MIGVLFALCIHVIHSSFTMQAHLLLAHQQTEAEAEAEMVCLAQAELGAEMLKEGERAESSKRRKVRSMNLIPS